MIISEDREIRDLEIYSVFTEFHWDNGKHETLQSLWKAVLQRLAFDFLGYKVLVTSTSDSRSLLIQHAREYVMHSEEFIEVCGLAEMDADTFRNRLVDLLNKNIFG